jgi:hypothetical protein
MLSVGARSHRFSPSQNVFIAVAPPPQPTVRQEASDELAMIGHGRTPPSDCSRGKKIEGQDLCDPPGGSLAGRSRFARASGSRR